MSESQNESQTLITKDSGVVILLLGETGVGKSTFINTAAGRPVAIVNHSLTPDELLVVRHFIVQHPQHSTRSFVFVETPGFDHLFATDEEILKQIIKWLKISCHSDVPFGGIVYLHDINNSRVQPMTAGTLTLVKLSRPEPAGHVLLTTVKWGRAQQDHLDAELRENELKSSNWKEILDRGSQICRFINTEDSAWNIIDTLLREEPLELHVIQQDLDRICRLFPKPVPPKRRGFFAFLFNFFKFK